MSEEHLYRRDEHLYRLSYVTIDGLAHRTDLRGYLAEQLADREFKRLTENELVLFAVIIVDNDIVRAIFTRAR